MRASDEAFDQLREAAKRDAQVIEKMAQVSQPSTDDFARLLTFVRLDSFTRYDDPRTTLSQPAKIAFAKLATRKPEVFTAYLDSGAALFKQSPYFVACLILVSVEHAPEILWTLKERNLIDDEAIRKALFREVRGNHPTDGSVFRPLNVDSVRRSLDSQLPQKLEIAFRLHEAGFSNARIDDVLIDSLTSQSVQASLKVRAIEKILIHLEPESYFDAIEALKTVVMKPAKNFGTVLDQGTVSFRAIEAIEKLATKESVTALWEIEGLNPTNDPLERPAEVVKMIITEARVARARLLFTHPFKDVPLKFKARRALRCLVGFKI